MICTFCVQFKDVAGQTSFVTGNKTYRIDSVRSHFSTPKHIHCESLSPRAKLRANNEEVIGPLDDALRTLGKKNKGLILYMFNTAYCVIIEEMPFTRFPTLLKLQVKNDSELVRLKSYQSDKACSR